MMVILYLKTVLDNNFNTRWSNYGSGSYIQIELEKNDILCAVDIAWHRGDVRINNFQSQLPKMVLPLLLSFLASPAAILIHMNHMWLTIPICMLQYIRVTVNGNTENDWASISEIRAFSKPSSTDPSGPGQPGPDPNPGQLPAGCIQDKVTRIGASGYDGNTVPQNCT